MSLSSPIVFALGYILDMGCSGYVSLIGKKSSLSKTLPLFCIILKERCAPDLSTFQLILLSIPYTDMNERISTFVRVTYVSYGLFGILSFLSVELAISVFVKHLAEYQIAIADDAITIKVKANIWYPFLTPVLIERTEGFRGLRATLPPVRNFDLLSRGSQSVIQRSLCSVFPACLLVQTLVIKAEGLMGRAVKRLGNFLSPRLAKDAA